MGEGLDFVVEESLISTAFFGGIWTALQISPESVLLRQIKEIGTILGHSGFASDIVALGQVTLFLWFIFVLVATFVIGRWLGIAGFIAMWLAGFFFIQGSILGPILLFVGWGFGVAGVAVHTDEQVRPSSGGRRPRI